MTKGSDTTHTGAAEPEHTAVETELDSTRQPQPLRDSAKDAIEHFLDELDGLPCSNLYDMVITQVEGPLLEAVMKHTGGNQSRTATMLGLNRGTLRKKLRQYSLLDPGDN